jgi:DNA-binding Xre family transcriptional regulator
MGKIVSQVRRLRFLYAAKLGRRVSIQEVSDQIGIKVNRLSQYELGRVEEIKVEELVKLCEFYGVTIDQVLEYDPSKQQAPRQAALINA